MQKFIIRDLQTYQEMLDVLQLQREIWGLTESSVGLYPPLLTTAAKNGGVVLGAFEAETERMIGFLVGILGRQPGGPLKLCSQIMGVKQEWRSWGVGESLKQAQRARVIAQDLPLITWTFDPLEGPNAQLNLHKLRGISRTYQRDIYGSHFGSLNAGLPTDRLFVEWWVQGERLSRGANHLIDEAEAAPVFVLADQGLAQRIAHSRLDLTAPALRLDIPADIQALKKADIDLAMDWRMQVRVAFEAYFAQGYIALDFLSTTAAEERHNRYLLQQATPELMAWIGIGE